MKHIYMFDSTLLKDNCPAIEYLNYAKVHFCKEKMKV